VKAIVYTRYGAPDAVLQLKEIARPTPQDNEVLIKVRAASVNAADWHLIRGKPLLIRPMFGGFRKPTKTQPGADVAGVVEAVGKDVKALRVGDEVFGDLAGIWGAFAEYACAPENRLLLKPANLSFEEAAAVPLAGVTALLGLRDKGHLQAGQKVLINGASGGVGIYAVQIAKAFGAEVTAVCSTRKMDMVRAIGADYVLDHTKMDFRKNGQRYDLIFDIAARRPFWAYRGSLNPGGIYLVVGGEMPSIFQMMIFGKLFSRAGGKSYDFVSSAPDVEKLAVLKTLLEEGKIRSVIDKCYPLSQTAEAIRYLEQGHVQGKTVISLG